MKSPIYINYTELIDVNEYQIGSDECRQKKLEQSIFPVHINCNCWTNSYSGSCRLLSSLWIRLNVALQVEYTQYREWKCRNPQLISREKYDAFNIYIYYSKYQFLTWFRFPIHVGKSSIECQTFKNTRMFFHSIVCD